MLEVQVKGVDSELLKAIFYKDGLVTSCIHIPANDTDFFKTIKGREVRGECISEISPRSVMGTLPYFPNLKKFSPKQLLREH